MKGTRKDRLAAFHRAGILGAAHELFLHQGVAGTTMDAIAQSSGYSKTTLYVYFQSKEDILNNLIHEAMERLRAQAEEIFAATSGFDDAFLAFCAVLADMHDSNRVCFGGLTGSIACSPEQTDKDETLGKIYRSGESLNARMEARIRQAAADGEIDAGLDIRETMMMTWFCLIGIIEKSSAKESYILRSLGKSLREFREASFRILLYSLWKRSTT